MRFMCFLSFFGCLLLVLSSISCVNKVEFRNESNQNQVQYQQILNNLYLEAKTPESWPEEIKDISAKILKSNLPALRKDKIDFAATCYVLSFKIIETDSFVNLMVESALQNLGTARSYREDALSALPEALKSIYLLTQSKTALEHILYLQLDGGPAETLWYVGLEILRSHPLEIASLLGEKHDYKIEILMQKEKIPPFVTTMKFRILEEEDYLNDIQQLVEKYKSDKSREADFFCKLMSRILNK
jgi:hypothetical protein